MKELSSDLKSLSHPIRLEILLLLEEEPNGGLLFGDLSRLLRIESSGKLSFHLNKLDQYLEKTPEGKYQLNVEGEKAVKALEGLGLSTKDPTPSVEKMSPPTRGGKTPVSSPFTESTLEYSTMWKLSFLVTFLFSFMFPFLPLVHSFILIYLIEKRSDITNTVSIVKILAVPIYFLLSFLVAFRVVPSLISMLGPNQEVVDQLGSLLGFHLLIFLGPLAGIFVYDKLYGLHMIPTLSDLKQTSEYLVVRYYLVLASSITGLAIFFSLLDFRANSPFLGYVRDELLHSVILIFLAIPVIAYTLMRILRVFLLNTDLEILLYDAPPRKRILLGITILSVLFSVVLRYLPVTPYGGWEFWILLIGGSFLYYFFAKMALDDLDL